MKSSRGIQQEEVWDAADELLTNGVRPTIERVRQKLGRGSPNTVTPMLEAWFSKLGERLGLVGTASGGNGMPPAVQRAFKEVWDRAMATATCQAQAELASQQQALATEKEDLQTAKEDMARELAVARQQESALKESLSLTQRLLEDAFAREATLQRTIEQRAQELVAERRNVSTLIQERNEERSRHDAQVQALVDDHRRQQELANASERRLLQEIDRVRQELKQTQRALEESHSRNEATISKLELAKQDLSAKLRDAELEVAGLRERDLAGQSRVEGLQRLVDQSLKNLAVTNSSTAGSIKRESKRKAHK